MKRCDYLSTEEGRIAVAIGFAIGAHGFDDPAWGDAVRAGYTNAVRAHGAGTLSPGAGRRAVDDLSKITGAPVGASATRNSPPPSANAREAGSTPARPTTPRPRRKGKSRP